MVGTEPSVSFIPGKHSIAELYHKFFYDFYIFIFIFVSYILYVKYLSLADPHFYPLHSILAPLHSHYSSLYLGIISLHSFKPFITLKFYQQNYFHNFFLNFPRTGCSFSSLHIYLFTCQFVVCACVCVCFMRKSEDNLMKLVHPFQLVGPRDTNYVIKFCVSLSTEPCYWPLYFIYLFIYSFIYLIYLYEQNSFR